MLTSVLHQEQVARSAYVLLKRGGGRLDFLPVPLESHLFRSAYEVCDIAAPVTTQLLQTVMSCPLVPNTWLPCHYSLRQRCRVDLILAQLPVTHPFAEDSRQH